MEDRHENVSKHRFCDGKVNPFHFITSIFLFSNWVKSSIDLEKGEENYESFIEKVYLMKLSITPRVIPGT